MLNIENLKVTGSFSLWLLAAVCDGELSFGVKRRFPYAPQSCFCWFLY